LSTDAEIEARMVASHLAFPGSTMNFEKHRFCRMTPTYTPELGAIVVAPAENGEAPGDYG
jgi:hypothetical protein